MDNKIIHQTLAKLEDNLANLESARTQVNSVSRKSEDLVSSFSKILKQIEKVQNDKLFDDDEFKKKIDASYVKFTKKINLTNKDFTDNYKVVSDDFKNEIRTILEKISSLKKVLDKLNITIINSEKKASDFDYNIAFKELTSELKSRIEKTESNHSRNINIIQNQLISGFENVIKKIYGIDTNSSIRALNNGISVNAKKIENIEHELKGNIEALKIDFESKLKSSLTGFKKAIILINLGSFCILLIILFGLALKWLNYI